MLLRARRDEVALLDDRARQVVLLIASGEGEREPVAAAQVASPVAAEGHELIPTGCGGGAAHLLVEAGDSAEGEREEEGHGLVRCWSPVIGHGRTNCSGL